MAGSLAHIVTDDGAFTMEFIENLGDAHEALEECFDLIGVLTSDLLQETRLRIACRDLRYPEPDVMPILGKRSQP